MIDTHCHLTDPRLMEQLDAVLARAAAAGVNDIVTIGTHPADWDAALTLTENQPHIRCAVGGHPNNCHEFDQSDLARLRDFCSNPAIVALGEMGLDYHHHFAPKTRQAQFFETQLQIAADLDMPVIIHCREAMNDCLAIIKKFPKVKAVFHCFTGTADEARQIWTAGHLTGFTGVVTFKNAQPLRDIAAKAPADRILIETDAPYLTPEPMRKQKTNEPALVVHTAAAIAESRNTTLEEFDALTTRNATNFYRWRQYKSPR